jgi:O-antigen/teichoic acid export membrane protein
VASIGQTTARGLAWLLAQTVGMKLATAGGQVVLAWLLQPRDFGLIGLAYTVIAFAGLVQQLGLQDILVQRHAEFRRWANATVWLALAGGCLAGVLSAAAAPFAAAAYQEPRLLGLILVLAVAAPLTALAEVPLARLRSEMQFGRYAAVNFATSFGTLALSVLFAALGFGAYSFVLPAPLVALARAAYLWRVAPPPFRFRTNWRRWRFLLGDGSAMFVSNVAYVLISQGDYVALGLAHSAAVVGVYYFAFNLSLQTMSLLTVNLWGVLLPALMKLGHDRPRQLAAFERAVGMLAVVSLPISFLQAALADPLVRLLFAPKWYPCIPVLQILSLGMAFHVVGVPGASLLQAIGRYRTLMYYSVAAAAVFCVAVAIGVRGGAVTLAVAVTAYYGLAGCCRLGVAVAAAGGTWASVLRVFFWPATIAAGATGLAALAGGRIPADWAGRDVVRVLVITILALALYLPLIRLARPATWQELAGYARGIVGQRRRRR